MAVLESLKAGNFIVFFVENFIAHLRHHDDGRLRRQGARRLRGQADRLGVRHRRRASLPPTATNHVTTIAGVLTLAIPVPIITGHFNRFYAHKTGRVRHGL